MDEAGRQWWTQRQLPCPSCGGIGVPIVLDMQDEETREAVRTGLAMLGGCGLGGAFYDHQCPRCGNRWSVGESGAG